MTSEINEEHVSEADVVIVGYGGAGATAAITAHDDGATVIIVEKMSSGGGNTRISGGGLFKSTSMEYVRYLEALSLGTTEKEILKAYAETLLHIEDWIGKIGGDLMRRPHLEVTYPPMPSGPHFPKVPGAEHIIYNLSVKGSETETGGKRLWRLLSTNVERRAIAVMTNTPAKGLVTNQKGEVIGVVADKEGKKILVKARRAIVLACGGFEYDDGMKDAYLPCKHFYAFGSPGNTGDGIYMAQKVGAALWHMTGAVGYLGFKTPEYQAAFAIRFYNEGFIYVNSQGRRFCSETELEHHHGWLAFSRLDARKVSSHPGYPDIPTFAIIDDVTRRKGPLNRRTNPQGFNQDLYEWSLDNSKEVAKGWIAQAKTIRELARRISVDELSLESTVAKYNECCKAGNDVEFGRARETLGAITTPPFYAIELWPSLVNTQGGPRRDEKARVLDREGKPIPRLYAAGELGSIFGRLYSGNNLTECIAFGQIAGRNAAAEKPCL